MNVHVVLGTYNGAKYLPAFLESLKRQTYELWTLHVRDDDSTDATRTFLIEAARSDSRIRIEPQSSPRGGVVENYRFLLQRAYDHGADFVACADQDDLWHVNKIQILAEQLQRHEQANPSVPLLIYSDMSVCGADGRIVHPSYSKHAGLRHDHDLECLLTSNPVAGCSAMVNRALLEAALPLPPETVMHDWWLVLCAAALGRVVYTPEQLVLYRQHSENTIGGEGIWSKLNIYRRSWRRRWSTMRTQFAASIRQAQALQSRLNTSGGCHATEVECVARFCGAMNPGARALRRRLAKFFSRKSRLHFLRETAYLAKLLTYDATQTLPAPPVRP